MWNYIRWTIISIGVVLVVGIGGLIGLAFAPGGCDEGPFSDRSSANSRGDVVAEYVKACKGIAAVVDLSITLQVHGAEKAITLAENDDPLSSGYPKFHWIDDDTLMIDLGVVRWIRPKTGKVGSIHITYAFSKGD